VAKKRTSLAGVAVLALDESPPAASVGGVERTRITGGAEPGTAAAPEHRGRQERLRGRCVLCRAILSASFCSFLGRGAG
jgi:hypothetical protein